MNKSCWHCGDALPADPPQAVVAGVAHAVCCPGCRAAAEWIDQLGLADYYRLRSAPAARPEVDAHPAQTPHQMQQAQQVPSGAASWQRPELARHVVRRLDGGHSEVLLLVDGIRCAACVWLIERALGTLAGVQTVQVNAAARRARVVWDPARCDLATLLGVLARTGYTALPLDAAALDSTRRREARDALKRLLVAGFGAMQAMMYASALYLDRTGTMDAATREAMRWLGLLVATPVVFYAAQPFFAGAWRSLRARRLGMDVPVALALGLIYGASVAEALRGTGEVYFDSVSMFVFFLLVGRFLEMRARHQAGDLAEAMARLSPVFADRVRDDGGIERIAAMDLAVGDLVQVAQGERVPADAVLQDAACRVDESLLSGESLPLPRRAGEALVGGSLLLDGPVRARVTRVGADTALAGIKALVARAHSQRPRLAQAGERAAAGFVARVLALATLTALGWSWFDLDRVLGATLAVLVVSCPCAFALAVPAALTRALSVLAARGVFVARADAVQALAGITHAVFDKTGTLTEVELQLDAVQGLDADEALAIAAALARGSRHPLSQALVRAAHGLPLRHASALRAQAGAGLQATLDGQRWRLGHAAYATGGADAADDDAALVLAGEHGAQARFALRERLRPGAAQAIQALRAAGVQVEIASGDAPARVAALARQLDVATWQARLSPADKLARLQALRANGASVLVVGDGVNDAPLLAGADVAVALASGAELAQASADIVLDAGRLGALAPARALARQTLAVLRQNQRWALVYNLSVLPLGALGLVPPWLAAIGMSASSLVVILNALRIGRERRSLPDPVAASVLAAAP